MARQWAALNPEAFRREPLMLAESHAARIVPSPPGVLDWCLTTTGAANSGERASAAAGYGAGRMDMVQLCDAFAINTLVFHADPGFCPKGEGRRLVPGGRLAVRTNGANPQGIGRCQTTTR